MKCLRSQSNYVQDEVHLEKLIRPLWEINPNAFTSLWLGNQLVAFCAYIRLTEQTVEIFKSHPITAPAMKMYDPNLPLYFACLSGVDPDLEADINGSVARALVRIIDDIKGGIILNLLSMPNWISYLPILGFERAPWADSVTQKGVEYRAFMLDLRNAEIHSLVDKIVSETELDEVDTVVDVSARESEPKLSLDEATNLVKIALKHYSSCI